MNKTLLASVSALALCAALAAPAMADCDVEDNGDVTNIVCTNNDNNGVREDNEEGDIVDVDVVNGASVTVPIWSGKDAIRIDSNGDVIFDSDTNTFIKSFWDDGIDINAQEGANITVNAQGTIQAGDNGLELSASGGGSIVATNSGHITAIDGFNVRGDGLIDITNDGKIDVLGDGINIIGSGAEPVTATNNGDIFAGNDGIDIISQGDGPVTVTNSGTIKALTGDGIIVIAEGNGDVGVANLEGGKITALIGDGFDIVAEGEGAINASNAGEIHAVLGDGYNIVANGTGAVTAKNDGLIEAFDTGIDIVANGGLVTATNNGTINVGGDGIEIVANADSAVNATNTGNIKTHGNGFDITTNGNGAVEARNSGTIDVDGDGYNIIANGTGAVTATNEGLIEAFDTGIDIVANGGLITATNSGTIDVGGDGIEIVANADSAVNATNTGNIKAHGNGFDITANGNGAVEARNSGTIDVDGDGFSIVADGNGGILAENLEGAAIFADGDGFDLTANGTGSIIANNAGNIMAEENGMLLQANEGDVNVTNTGQILAEKTGVSAAGNGEVVIANNAGGLIQSGELAIDASADGAITIDNAGVIRNKLAAEGDPDAVFERIIVAQSEADVLLNNSNLLIGNVLLSSADGATMNNTGLWKVGGDNTFADSDNDVLNNTGTITAFGTTNFSGLDDFNNAGGLLTMLDEDGVFEVTNTDGNFTGGYGSVLSIDAELGNESGADLADLLTARNFRDQTGVHVNDLLADATAGFNPEGVIFASFGNETDDDAFFLIDGPVDKGLFSFDVFLDEANQDWVLASAPDATFFELPSIITGVQQNWHEAAGSWLDRTADLRTAITEQCYGGLKDPLCSTSTVTPGLWAKVVGATTQRSQQQQNFALLNKNLTFDISYDQVSTGIIGGFDVGEQNGDSAWIGGVFGGYLTSDLNFEESPTSVDYKAGLVGGYATYLDGGFFADAKVVAQFGQAEYKSVSGIFAEEQDTDFSAIGGTLEAGYRLLVGNGFFIEPGASLAYVNADVDDLAIFGEVVQFEDGESLRGRIGARIGTSLATDSVKIEPFVGLNVLQEFNDENVTSVVSNGFELKATDEIAQTFGEVTAGVNVLDLGDSGLSGFVKGNAQFGENDFENYTGNAGIRLKF